MIRILANDGISDDGKLLMEEAGYEVITKKVPQNELCDVIGNYDVLLVRSATKVTAEVITAGTNLKMIGRGGVGLDNIDVEFAESKGIIVFNTPAASSQAVAELAFGHMFNLARFMHQANRNMALNGLTTFDTLKKNYGSGIQLRGKSLGIIGFGRIGQEVARIGLALGMNVLPTDLMINEANIDINIFANEKVTMNIHVPTVPYKEVLAKSDFISLHIPFGGGKPLIGAEEISSMKKGVYLINTARGGAIDETALLAALSSGQVAGAGLDVFENEPTPKAELLEHPNISLTPHIGAATNEAQANIGLEIADRVIAFFGDQR
ncbi:MAG: D-2-hydroxyacid dehydrogenase [Saprospiraceae bacterium]|jgi:D-3-phosphoglycerate dehydrogenase|nr:D-2-hydroxyacid dehydrogenase [Saprospiraceae bacterium]MCF8317492.1 D-2-hydroxyacid dehydrogenase [Haliscomenobacter sp.]